MLFNMLSVNAPWSNFPFPAQIHKSDVESIDDEEDDDNDDNAESDDIIGDITAVAASEGEFRPPPVSSPTTEATKTKKANEGPPIWITMGTP